MSSCATPLSDEELLEYLGGDLTAEAEDDLEVHLFTCAACAARAERLGALIASVAGVIPPVLSPARLAHLERDGHIEGENPMRPGDETRAWYPAPGRILLHRLGGPELASAGRLDLRITSPGTPLDWLVEGVPVDRGRSEVLVACQSHFTAFPRQIVFTLESVVSNERRELARYTVHHRLRGEATPEG